MFPMLCKRFSLLALSLCGLILTAGVAYGQQAEDPPPTPAPVTRYEFTLWKDFEIPAVVRNGLTRPHIAFINANDSAEVTSLATAQPTTDTTTLYYVDPNPNNFNNLYPIAEFTTGTLEAVYLSPLGNSFAYLLNDRAGPNERGLWYVDVGLNFGARILNENSFNMRGLFNPPVWSADGRRLAVVWETGYGLDIFEFNLDSSVWAGLVIDGSYNFWPSWSPDGLWLAFVSDREICPSWVPGDADACNASTDLPPIGGHVYVLNIQTGVISRLSDEETFEPPYWINGSTLAFSAGDPFDLFDPARSLWVGDVRTMQAEEIRLAGSNATLYLSERWARDASKVVAQVVGADNTTEIIVIGRDGQRVNDVTQVAFSRYAMDASWSGAGDRLALGGTSGQCPSALRVLNANYGVISNFNQPTNVCAPRFAPDDSAIVFTGISQERRAIDGRRDIYVSDRDGIGGRNLTINLRGQMNLIGWVGPD